MDNFISDHCEECIILGDNYFVDETGLLVDLCIDCPFGQRWDGVYKED